MLWINSWNRELRVLEYLERVDEGVHYVHLMKACRYFSQKGSLIRHSWRNLRCLTCFVHFHTSQMDPQLFHRLQWRCTNIHRDQTEAGLRCGLRLAPPSLKWPWMSKGCRSVQSHTRSDSLVQSWFLNIPSGYDSSILCLIRILWCGKTPPVKFTNEHFICHLSAIKKTCLL